MSNQNNLTQPIARSLIFYVIGFVMCTAWPRTALIAQVTTNAPVTTDAHFHMLDFLQNGEYLDDGRLVYSSPANTLSSGERGKRIEAVLWAMDQANVSHAVIMGMPFLKKWGASDAFRPQYYLDSSSRLVRARDTDYILALAIEDYRRTHGVAAESELTRLFPSISGFDGTDLGAVDMIVKRIKEFPGMFKAIGEAMSRHDDLTNLTTGERPRADHPAFFRIFDFAGRIGMPVTIHHNIAPVSPSEEVRDPDYLPEILRAFEEFPSTTFIWSHAGIQPPHQSSRPSGHPRCDSRRAPESCLRRSVMGRIRGLCHEGTGLMVRPD